MCSTLQLILFCSNYSNQTILVDFVLYLFLGNAFGLDNVMRTIKKTIDYIFGIILYFHVQYLE